MELKLLGAILIVAGCGGYGFSLCTRYRKRERALSDLVRALDRMECELQYRLTPLPELCRGAAQDTGGMLRRVFLSLAQELERRVMPDAASCMACVISNEAITYKQLRIILSQLGKSLGQFDLPGQLGGLEAVRKQCILELDALNMNRSERLRCYKTLGLCAGAALAILFA